MHYVWRMLVIYFEKDSVIIREQGFYIQGISANMSLASFFPSLMPKNSKQDIWMLVTCYLYKCTRSSQEEKKN